MSTPRTKRRLRTQQAILDAARTIIVEDGLAALSMRTLADRIDYSPAGLYEYFSSKEEIVGAVCDEGQGFLFEAMDQVDKTLPPTDYLNGIGIAYIGFALERPDYFLVMFTAAPPPPEMAGASAEEVHAMLTSQGSAYGILIDAIQRGIDADIFRVRPGFGRDEMAYAAWTLVHGIAMLRTTALRHFPVDLASSDRQVLRNFVRGLTAP